MEGGTKYSQERDSSGKLAEAQPGTLGLYVTAGEHTAFASALDIILAVRSVSTAIIRGGGRRSGQGFE
jgi:hypothetical protein